AVGQALHDLGSDAVVVHAPDGTLLSLNPAARELFGVGPDWPGRSVADLPVWFVNERGHALNPAAVFAPSAAASTIIGPSAIGMVPRHGGGARAQAQGGGATGGAATGAAQGAGATARWIEVTTRAVDGPDRPRLLSTVRDRAEELARTAGQDHELGFTRAPDGLAVTSTAWHVGTANEAF